MDILLIEAVLLLFLIAITIVIILDKDLLSSSIITVSPFQRHVLSHEPRICAVLAFIR